MKKKLFLMSILLSIVNLTNAATCGCGSMSGGLTTEYSIADTPGVEPDCCQGIAVGAGYQFSWASNGGGTYVLTGAVTVRGSEAQANCCHPPTT